MDRSGQLLKDQEARLKCSCFGLSGAGVKGFGLSCGLLSALDIQIKERYVKYVVLRINIE